MIDSIHACVDLLHVGYHVKDEYDPIILNVYHCLKVEGKNDEKYIKIVKDVGIQANLGIRRKGYDFQSDTSEYN